MTKKKGRLKGIKNLEIDLEKIVDFIDKIPVAIDVAIKAGLAYYGFKATDHISGSLAALIAFELAKSQNIVAGTAGLASLGLIGLGTISKEHKFLTPFRGGYK